MYIYNKEKNITIKIIEVISKYGEYKFVLLNTDDVGMINIKTLKFISDNKFYDSYFVGIDNGDDLGYRKPVKFTKTNLYGNGPKGDDEVYTVDEFIECCNDGSFIDYDGYGHPVKDCKSNPDIMIEPSKYKDIPKDATHIVWFNR